MQKGPLGFPVVDVAVTLTDGSYHSVDSELAFRLAGRVAMQEAMTEAVPHLLEPVQKLVLVTPSWASSRVSSAVGKPARPNLGLGPREGWTGWDRIEALIPEAEFSGLEAELLMSQGLASYEAEFDHLAESAVTLPTRWCSSRSRTGLGQARHRHNRVPITQPVRDAKSSGTARPSGMPSFT